VTRGSCVPVSGMRGSISAEKRTSQKPLSASQFGLDATVKRRHFRRTVVPSGPKVLVIIFAKQLNGSIPRASHHRLAEAASDDG
jgi:hypothetical protein